MDINNPSQSPIDIKDIKPQKIEWKRPAKLILILAVIVGFFSLIRIYTDFLWFEALNFPEVFTTIVFTKINIFLFIVIVSFLILFFNGLLIIKRSKKHHIKGIYALSSGVIAVLLGLTFKESWLTFLQYLNPTNFNILDPLFSKDVSFYFFTLPFYSIVLSYLFVMVVILLITSAVLYLFSHVKKKKVQPSLDLNEKAKYHLSIIGGVFFVLLAFSYYLKRFNLLYSPGGIDAWSNIH